jgi:K+-sensing histidine kinase KdpD
MAEAAERARGWRPYAAALGVVGASTMTAELLFRALDTTRLSMIFLAGVLITAVRWGSGPGYFAAVAAFVIYDFYLSEPRFTLQFGSAEDVLVLIVFFAVAMLTGRLAGKVRDEAARALDRAHTTDALLQASREFSSSADEETIRQRLARHVGEAAKGDGLVWHGDRRWSWPAVVDPPEGLVTDTLAITGRTPDMGGVTVTSGSWRARQLVAAGDALGVAAWRSVGPTRLGPEEQRLLNVLVDLGATAIARARLASAQAEMEARVRTEQLRDALLSSLSHDLRTPLAAIMASASSLREFGDQFEPATRADLVLTIQEETERLNIFVTNLLNMTRLESGALAIDSTGFSVAEMVERVIGRFSRRGGEHRLSPSIRPVDLHACGDPILAEHALANVVENALRFSPGGSPVGITANPRGNLAVIEVADEGPGVPNDELASIFEKFYRSPQSAATLQGTGLGLSITKGLVEAMGGAVAARPRAGGSGLVVSLTLPRRAA